MNDGRPRPVDLLGEAEAVGFCSAFDTKPHVDYTMRVFGPGLAEVGSDFKTVVVGNGFKRPLRCQCFEGSDAGCDSIVNPLAYAQLLQIYKSSYNKSPGSMYGYDLMGTQPGQKIPWKVNPTS